MAACFRRATTVAAPSVAVHHIPQLRIRYLHVNSKRSGVGRVALRSRRLVVEAAATLPRGEEEEEEEKVKKSGESAALLCSFDQEEEAGRNGESVDRKVEVMVAATATVVLGVGNRVLYKLALVPLKQYPFFLAQLATFGILRVSGSQGQRPMGDFDEGVILAGALDSNPKWTYPIHGVYCRSKLINLYKLPRITCK